MQTSDFNNERTFTFSEIADQLGVSEEDFISCAIQHGLIDSNGMPTEFAIQEGFLRVMPTSDFNSEERTFTFSEIADQLGVSEEEIISFGIQHGLIDSNGLPTEFAIQKGLLRVELNLYFN